MSRYEKFSLFWAWFAPAASACCLASILHGQGIRWFTAWALAGCAYTMTNAGARK